MDLVSFPIKCNHNFYNQLRLMEAEEQKIKYMNE
jgi:hypothetical protein